MWLGKASFCDPNVFSSSYLPAIVICRLIFTQKRNYFLVYSKCYYSISVRLTVILLRNKPQSVTFQRRPTPCISSKNSMQFTLGMPFLGILGTFYRNRKWLKKERASFLLNRDGSRCSSLLEWKAATSCDAASCQQHKQHHQENGGRSGVEEHDSMMLLKY